MSLSFVQRAARMRSAAFPAIMTTGTLVLPDTSAGMMLQSTTRRADHAVNLELAVDHRHRIALECRPSCKSRSGWKIVPPVFFANSSRSSSLLAAGSGRYSTFT